MIYKGHYLGSVYSILSVIFDLASVGYVGGHVKFLESLRALARTIVSE